MGPCMQATTQTLGDVLVVFLGGGTGRPPPVSIALPPGRAAKGTGCAMIGVMQMPNSEGKLGFWMSLCITTSHLIKRAHVLVETKGPLLKWMDRWGQ